MNCNRCGFHRSETDWFDGPLAEAPDVSTEPDCEHVFPGAPEEATP